MSAAQSPFWRRIAAFEMPSPLPPQAVLALACVYFFVGVLGHDPWKHDDAIGFGIAWTMHIGGVADWLLPNIGGIAQHDEGPLYFWCAALAIKLFGAHTALTAGWIAPYEAARLPAFMGWLLVTWRMTRIGKTLYATHSNALAGGIGALVFVGCAGLFTRAHQASAEVAVVLCLTFAIEGLLRLNAASAARDTNRARSMVILSMAAMAWATAGQGLALILIVALSAAWAVPKARSTVALGAALAGVGVLMRVDLGEWLASPAVPTSTWHTAQWASWGLPQANLLAFYAKNAVWFTFPAWPLVFAWAWRNRRDAQAHSALRDTLNDTLHDDAQMRAGVLGRAREARRLCLGLVLGMVVALSFAQQQGFALLLASLPPLSLIGGFGALAMRRNAAAGFDWFAALLGSGYAIYLAFYGFAVQTGVPPRAAAAMLRREPGFELVMSPWALGLAGLALLAWAWSLLRIARGTPRAARIGTTRGVTRWALGLALSWILLMTLWLPNIEYGKTFRNVAAQLTQVIRHANATAQVCVAAELDDSERASLLYFLGQSGIVLKPITATCPLRLSSVSHDSVHTPGAGWLLIWSGGRGPRTEQLLLYRKTP